MAQSSTAFNKIPKFLSESQLRTGENQLSKKDIYVVLTKIQFLLCLLLSLVPT